MTNEEGQQVAQEIQRSLKTLTIAVLACLVLSIGVLVFAIVLSVRITNETTRTTTALCTFRDDLSSRVKQTEDFLVSHPDGFAGIPKASLIQSLQGQKRTIESLSTLECPEPKAPAP